MAEPCQLILPTAGLARTHAASRRHLYHHPPMVTSCPSKEHGQPESQILAMPRAQTGGLEKTGKCRRLGRAPATPRSPEMIVVRLFYGLNLVGFATRVRVITHKLSEKSHDPARASLLTQSEMPRLGGQDDSMAPISRITLLRLISSPPQLIS